MGLELLGEYLDYVHCKNAAWISRRVNDRTEWHWDWVPVREGIVNWKQVIGILKNIGFDGYISNEDFCSLPISQKLEEDIAYIKSLVEG